MAIDKEYASIILKWVFEKGVCSNQITLISIQHAILTAASEYFSASPRSNFQEGGETEFTLDGTDGETVKAIVDFCYTGISIHERHTGQRYVHKSAKKFFKSKIMKIQFKFQIRWLWIWRMLISSFNWIEIRKRILIIRTKIKCEMSATVSTRIRYTYEMKKNPFRNYRNERIDCT